MFSIESIANVLNLSEEHTLGLTLIVLDDYGIPSDMLGDQEVLSLVLDTLRSMVGKTIEPTQSLINDRIAESQALTEKRENTGESLEYETRLEPRRKRHNTLDKKQKKTINVSVSENVARKEIAVVSGDYVYNIDRRYALTFAKNKVYLLDKKQHADSNGNKHRKKPVLIFWLMGLYPDYPVTVSINFSKLPYSEQCIVTHFLNELRNLTTDNGKIIDLRYWLTMTSETGFVNGVSDSTPLYSEFNLWLEGKSYNAINNWVKTLRKRGLNCSGWFIVNGDQKTVNKDKLFELWLQSQKTDKKQHKPKNTNEFYTSNGKKLGEMAIYT